MNYEVSKEYSISFAGQLGFSTFYLGVPVGATNYLEPLQNAGDGKYVRFTLDGLPLAIGAIAWNVTPDAVIPTGVTLNSIQLKFRYAGLAGFDDAWGKVWRLDPSAAAEASLPAPLIDAKNPPEDAAFREGTVTFLPSDIPGGFSIEDFIRGAFAFEFGVGPSSSSWFLDKASLILTFTLGMPQTIGIPSFERIKMNKFTAVGAISLPIDSANEEYPLLAWVDYTRVIPNGDQTAGQSEIYRTPKIEITNQSSLTRVVNVLGTTDLIVPNTTYYARISVESAGGEQASGEWASVQTSQFDDVVSA